MFKKIFNGIRNSFKDFWGYIKKSKVAKIGGKIIKTICSASVTITAFNVGNLMEAINKLSDQPVTLTDTFRWMFIMCGDWIKSIKAHNFTWDVKWIFIPFVIAVSYASAKVGKILIKFIKWVKNANTAIKMNNEKTIPHLAVANPFDN